MAQRDEEASEIASIMDDVISNTVAAGNQLINTDEMAGINVGGNNNKTIFNCIVPECDFVTPGCDLETVANDLLSLHIKVAHKEQLKSDKIKHVNKMFVPEVLDLNPSDNCNEEFDFWWTRFALYLSECGVDQPTEMYEKLICRLSFRISQFVDDCHDFKSLEAALRKLFTKKENMFMARDRLLSCKQKTNENVRSFFQRIKNLAKFCCFNSPEYREDWECQAFLSGLGSRAMRLGILERESANASEVFQTAENFERSFKELLMFDTSKQDSGIDGVQKTSKTKRIFQGGIGIGNHPYEGLGHQRRQW